MKFIESAELSRLAQSLTHDGAECSVHTRIEVYSCKNIKRDKKLFKSLEEAYQDEASHSPPLPLWLPLDKEAEMTPFGPFNKEYSRKTLYLLIAALNVAFPDYDFSDVRPSQFNKEESGASVLNSLSTTLVSPSAAGVDAPRTYSAYPPGSELFPSSVPTSSSPYDTIISSPNAPAPIVSGTHPSVFRLIDDVIGLSECEVFSYVPDIEADPHANDFSDDEDDVASIGDEDSSSGDDSHGVTFEFDDEDELDELAPYGSGGSSRSNSHQLPPPTPRKSSADSSFTIEDTNGSYGPVRMKRRGALLWSSHWFFLNRKQKRILFISIWSRSRRSERFWMHGEAWDSSFESKDSFSGWEGDVGLGARSIYPNMGFSSTT